MKRGTGQEGAIVREDADAEEPEPGGDGEHEQKPAEQEKESDEEEIDGEAPAVALPISATAANAKTTFGMKRSNPTVKKGNDTYDYEQKYPEDAPYEEAAPAARVWRTYEDESRNHDANMVEESRDNVDVLLVFAGLFSAVVTTLVVQTSQSLQPDYAAMSASLLYESILVQRAVANGSPVNAISPSPLNPTIAFVPTTTDVWVNGLWFTSLFLSLTTALVAVLVKQWLHHYVSLPSGTPRDRSFTRQFRYAGFQKWHVQVIIGLLPVLMHLALAIFLSGLVIFLHPLRAALSWIICAGTAVVYAAYVLAAILPIIFPQCPYRTPLCDLVYVSFCRIVPRVTWHDKEEFLSSYRERDFGRMFHNLLHVQARAPQSLTTVESEVVQQMSTNLAAEALHWLFSVTSNLTVQSIVVQSIGGLPMASEEKFLLFQGDTTKVDTLRDSLLRDCFQGKPSREELAGARYRHFNTADINSFELTVAMLSSGYHLSNGETFESVSPGTFFIDITRSSKLPPRCWYHLMMRKQEDVFLPLDPDNDDHANTFPLHLCPAILYSFDASRKGLTQDFDSSLDLRDFRGSVPYFLDKIYDPVLRMFSKFVKDPSLDEPSLPQSLRVFVAVTKFMLHRLSLLEYDVLFHHSLEAPAVMTVLDDILAAFVVPPLDTGPYWRGLCNITILTYRTLTTVDPSACSLGGLRSMVDFMTIQWDQMSHLPDVASRVLTDLLVKRLPIAFTAFLEKQCLQFLGNHIFRTASVPMVSAYVAGIFAMKQGLDGAMDAETLQQHIDHLHNPHTLFTVCSILAMQDIDRSAIYRDIMTLVQLRQRDAAWNECRKKLHDLVESDVGDFFSKQFVLSKCEVRRPLETYEIQVKKDNVRYAIQVLDDFFDGGAYTNYTIGRLDRFLGWCLGRKPESKLELEQQV
ncbi:uncharacterized protein ARMOST_08109 [Armillaria ostoyae]|uniref:DUF6535 domain-containing protein n=1 Tax=Armillaria ostoyae TaxID=47428 RepID=A0A284R7T9_ARMOS|nr:uncharacterized protein ARMOST_08109 [Armillaria ostoyae]